MRSGARVDVLDAGKLDLRGSYVGSWRRHAANATNRGFYAACRSLSACRRAASSPASAPSMRHSSSTSCARSSRSTSARATASPRLAASRSGCACFTTRKWRVASEATWGRWVMHRTWRLAGQRPQALAHRARRRAADAGVDLVEDDGRRALDGRGDAHQRQHHPRQLAARRRPRAAARPRRPGFGPIRNSTESAPGGTEPRQRAVAGARPLPRSPTSNVASAIARSASSAHTAFASARPPFSRAGAQAAAPARPARRRARSSSASSRAVVSPAFASRSRSARQRSACSSTASIVPPCFRFRRASCSSRSSTAAKPPRVRLQRRRGRSAARPRRPAARM